MDNDLRHETVLLQQAVEALDIKTDGIYVDGTFGRGGHSLEILTRLQDDGMLIAIDKDPEAIARAQEAAFARENFHIEHCSFNSVEDVVKKHTVDGKVDGILLDLGVSSPQLDSPKRGFSFLRDGPLDMRMDTTRGYSAADWLARVKEQDLAQVLRDYGEERFAKRIAKAIVKARQQQDISGTLQLAKIIAEANPAWEKHKHPATRSFQAIRIFVNRELDDLKDCLSAAVKSLKYGGRLVIISFHSLEDRIVKQFIRQSCRGDVFPKGLPVTQDKVKPQLKKIGSATKPDAEEISGNNRARSAIMRVAEKII